MLYVIVQIWLWLALAALLGFVVGWLLRGRLMNRRLNSVEDDVLMFQAARDRAEQENRRLTARVLALEEEMRRVVAEPALAGEPEAKDGEPWTADGTRPPALKAPRAGVPDDLKQIHGIGEKLEDVLHRLGIYHFDQIAHWTPEHVAWVDGYLRFKGRIEREDWIRQARVLAAQTGSGTG